jgi:hypothetical protein
MSYIYDEIDALENTELVGSHQCVALVQHYARAPQSTLWKAGGTVKGNLLIAKGTAIATFVDGKYPSHASGNHAAFFVSQDAGGIWIMDQWNNLERKPKVSKRYILSRGKKDNSYINPSNNADAYSIIE